MSFTPFTSDPTAPAGGKPALQAALAPAGEPPALPVPAPAGWKTGGTPSSRASTVAGATSKCASPSDSLSTCGEGRGEAAWLVPESLLSEIEPEARPLVQRAFTERLKLAQAEREQPPEQRHLAPPPFLYQHLARPRFQQSEPRQADQIGLHRLLRVTLWLAVDALEAGVLFSAGNAYQLLLAEQCAQLGRIYREVKQRAGALLALVILQGELRFLRHRGASAVEQLLFA